MTRTASNTTVMMRPAGVIDRNAAASWAKVLFKKSTAGILAGVVQCDELPDEGEFVSLSRGGLGGGFHDVLAGRNSNREGGATFGQLRAVKSPP